jgi:hypothetical protein
VLDLRPNCECRNKDLPPEATEAMICSFECHLLPGLRRLSVGAARIGAASWCLVPFARPRN